MRNYLIIARFLQPQHVDTMYTSLFLLIRIITATPTGQEALNEYLKTKTVTIEY